MYHSSSQKKGFSFEPIINTDSLGPIREAMAQKDDDWEKWGLEELVEHLRRLLEG